MPEPPDPPEPPPTPADEFLVARGAEVFERDGVADAAAERLGAGLGETAPLDELTDVLTDADTVLPGERFPSAGSSALVPPAAEHPTTHRPASTTTALRTAGPRGRSLDISGLSSLTCFIPLIRCSDVPNVRNPPPKRSRVAKS
ncbi:hypothetical protein ACWD3J_27045 [Streptomyces sp. NPDC002755]|uniref:hypothetical protein n=1 Tax=Streptomyces sp. NPDC002884 TaxID=3154544 RepID=UPI00332CF849